MRERALRIIVYFHICMSQGIYALSINNYSSSNIDVLQVDVTAKISHCHDCGALSNELFWFYHDFNNCFYRG